jgi:nucleoid DNA-binding protein
MKKTYQTLEVEDLIKEFYETVVKEQYPDMTEEQVTNAITSCWKCVREFMNSEELPNIRLHHFGIFKVYKGNVVRLNKLFDGDRKMNLKKDQKYYDKKNEIRKKKSANYEL